MKKRITFLLLAAMLIGSLTACGNNSQNEAPGSDAAVTQSGGEETQTQKEETGSGDVGSEDIYEIVMIIPTLGTEPAGLADVEEAVNAIVEPELGVNISLYPIFIYDLTSQTNLMLQSGDKLDLLISFVTGVGSYVSKDAIMPLDDLYAQYGQDIEKAEGVALAGGYYNGQLYAIPSEEKHARSYGFFARTDILNELGFEVSKDEVYTLEDLTELFTAYKEKYGEGYYCVAGTSATTELYSNINELDVLGAGISTGVLTGGGLDGDSTVKNLYESLEYEAYAQQMYEWAQAGFFSPDASTNTDAGTIQVQSGYYLGQFSSTETDMESNLSRDCGYDMTAINLVAPYASTSMYMVSMWSVPTNCENPEKVFRFLNMLYGDNEIANILTNGLKDVTYEVVEEGERPGQMVVHYAEGVDAANAPYIMPLHVFGDKLNIAVFEPMSLDYYTLAEEFNAGLPDSRKSLSLGYVFNSESVAAQRSAVEAVVQQYSGIVATGAQDPSSVLPQFQKALRDAGIEDIIVENQTQLDQWLSEQ